MNQKLDLQKVSKPFNKNEVILLKIDSLFPLKILLWMIPVFAPGSTENSNRGER